MGLRLSGRNRKGQVALFIAVGVVALLLVVVLFSERSTPAQKDAYLVTEQIDEQFSGVRNFVQSCLEQTANNGLDLIGQQGGYIDPAAAGIASGYPGKQKTDGFPFTRGGFVVPYWYYLASPMDCSGDCAFDTKAPALDGADPHSIQSQLQEYIAGHIDQCLDGFSQLSAQGYTVVPSGTKQTKILFRDNDTRVYLELPLNATRGDKTQAITQFGVDIQIPLRPLYNYALLLTASQAQYAYLEHQVLTLISLNSGTSPKLLPPTSATTYDYVSTAFWLRSRVKEQLEADILPRVEGLQVANALNFHPVTYQNPDVSDSTRQTIQRIYDNMILPLNNSDPSDPLNHRFNVNYEYLNWPTYFDVNSDGEMIKPSSMAVSDFMTGFQVYSTYYDLTFPVRVVLSDPSARKQQGYTFAFGLEGNIRGNEPLNENYTLQTGPSAFAGTFVCNADQFNSGAASVTVVDNVTHQPIADTSLTFTCGTETCTIGTTDENGHWAGKLPICGGAQLTLSKDESYAQRALQVSTNLNEDVPLGTIALQPYRQTTAAVMKKELKKQPDGQWQFVNTPVALDPKEFAIISYKQVDPAPGTDPVQGATVYYGSSGPSDATKIKLVPGVYEVNVQTILDSPIIVPAQERNKKVLFKKITFTIPQVAFQQFPSGTLTLDDTKGYWYVSANDLDAGNDAVTFYVLAPDIPGIAENKRVVEDLQILNDEDKYLVAQYAALQPLFGPVSSLAQPTGASGPIIALQPLVSSVKAGALLPVAVSQLGDEIIKTYSVTSPVVSPAQPFTSNTLNINIPEDAFGNTVVTVVLTMADGTKITKSTTVQVTGESALNKLSLIVGNQPAADVYTLSKSSLPPSQTASFKILGVFADGTTKDLTTSDEMSIGTTNISVIDESSAGLLKIGDAGRANVTAQYGNLSIEVPITILQ